MSEEDSNLLVTPLILFLVLITGTVVAADSLETDKQVLLKLKSYLQETNRFNSGPYSDWNNQSTDPCRWLRVSCSNTRVTGIYLSHSNISGEMFQKFSQLTELTHLDLSMNTISVIPPDLRLCQKLVYLNLSHNIITGELNLTGLNRLETLDLAVNRIHGDVGLNFPAICDTLVTLNISENNFTGSIGKSFDRCLKLQYLDLSTNKLSGDLWIGFERLTKLSVSENFLSGTIQQSYFTENCILQILDLSQNSFQGVLPREIAHCKNLVTLNLWGNDLTGNIPTELGYIPNLEALYLGNNSFYRDIPDTLVNLSKLTFLDLSMNSFGGEIQNIFGRLTQVKFLLLDSNSYTGGINSSGILNLQNISRLDLSYNDFSGPLPIEISQMSSLKFLILAHNDFTGIIPPEYGFTPSLQALDLSYNRLSGPIPSSLGNLKSLLWLMLGNNSLTGEIPSELGNCSSLLWLNLENNQLSGFFPSELTNIGVTSMSTFESNRDGDHFSAGSGECLTMKRWIPADYPPFNFLDTILTRKNCRIYWESLLQGYGIFPICGGGSSIRTFQISGYIQLSGNQLTGKIPSSIGKLQNMSMLQLGTNSFYGELPPEIGQMSLVVLNISKNNFSGEIPMQIADLKCLQILDVSQNNFSGTFPTSLNNLNDLSKFNISYNPLISGVVPSTGQLVTFEKNSYFGDPLLVLPKFIDNSTNQSPNDTLPIGEPKTAKLQAGPFITLALSIFFLLCGVMCLTVCFTMKNSSKAPGYLLEDTKYEHDLEASSGSSSPSSSDNVKVIRLDRTAFTYGDILKATENFAEDRIIGKGGYGTVYKGLLPDGREIAVKKLQREGAEGEREFRAEMEVLSGNSFSWPHSNLVTLYGWCLHGSEKVLVYEYMEGGSLEDLVADRVRLTWHRRIDVAIDVARALTYLHHECYPAIVHRDVKASNVLLDKSGKARVTDFGLARVVDAGVSHVSTMVAGTVGYVAPEYGQIWHATTKGDVYSYGVLAMELATGRRALDGGEECLVDWARRVMGHGRKELRLSAMPVIVMGSGLAEGREEMSELLRIGVKCTADSPQARPNMKEVLAMLIKISNNNHSD